MSLSTKADLRLAALERRAAVPGEVRQAFAARATREGLELARLHRSRVTGAYWPIRSEADPLPLLAALADAGLATALPAVAGRGKPLAFRLWRPGDPLADGPLGLREPPPDAPALDPDLLFVPLAAFDRAGHRLGYGAGYYDATLAALAPKRPLAIGLAFSTQEVASIPAEPHDHPLAFVITERETIDCRVSRNHASSVYR
jgi:5-formyltetrahydrofolate cyclo-ligase